MEIMEYTDTIAAIATAMGNSGIGIVRISGENAVEVAEKCSAPRERRNSRKLRVTRSITDMFMMEMRRSMRSF